MTAPTHRVTTGNRIRVAYAWIFLIGLILWAAGDAHHPSFLVAIMCGPGILWLIGVIVVGVFTRGRGAALMAWDFEKIVEHSRTFIDEMGALGLGARVTVYAADGSSRFSMSTGGYQDEEHDA